MARQKKTQERLDAAIEVLTEDRPMTVRQVYYQLVSRQVVENTRTMYQAISDLLVEARKDGTIPWDWIEDRLRRPRQVDMWSSIEEIARSALASYRLDVWPSQSVYVEVWEEKDALSGIFEGILEDYGVTLNVGRGYDGWDSIRNAAARLNAWQDSVILYFGDFDPSGEDMFHSLRKRLAFFDCQPEMVKCALTYDDITRYNLPPNFTKSTDSRAAAHIAKWGDVSVELDALPAAVLRQRIVDEVEARLDMDALARVQAQERDDRRRLRELLKL